MVYKNVPGVFIEEVSLLPPSVAGVPTGIPAFVGHTQKATTLDGNPLTLQPTRIISLREYEDYFGKAEPEDDLVVTVKDGVISAKFKTAPAGSGGGSAASGAGSGSGGSASAAAAAGGAANTFNMYYALQLYFANGGGPCYIVSVGGTGSGNPDPGKIKEGLAELAKEDEPTMIVIPEAHTLKDTDYFDVYDTALTQCADLKDRVTIIDVKFTGKDKITTDINTNFRGGNLKVDNLRYGAAYYPYLETTIDFDFTGKEANIAVDNEGTQTTLGALKTSNNLLYEQCRQALNTVPMTMPPSPAIAGVYARVDSDRGVWKAPANVGISSISGVSVKITDAHQDFMNVDPTSGKSVNAIRTVSGRGTVVWGARTLQGNSNEWRYINVRRFFNYVEESVKKASYQFVFEPNDANTWVKVRAMIENFLTNLWRDGALMGSKPEQAFTVRIGLGQTMTPQDILEGKMIVEIGMAVVRPAEFIYLRFSHKMPEA